METLNSTSSPTAQGLDATLGDNSTFNAFMVAIAEIDKSTLFDNSQDTSDTVCLLFFAIPLRNGPIQFFAALLDVAVLFAVWVLPGRGSKQPGEHRVHVQHNRGATSLV